MEHQLKYYGTLFLDRDGVINKRPGNGYVTKWSDFHFLPGVLEALKKLHSIFNRIIVVTNQQGIGKKLMTVVDLELIHSKMLETIKQYGGRIDAVYFCPDLVTDTKTCRKPGIEMAQRAQNHFPDVDFRKSIMAGDTENDMLFGRNAGMTNALISKSNLSVDKELFDYQFISLLDFANYLSAND
jgi:histidinol-phosphate phosphatase family protein